MFSWVGIAGTDLQRGALNFSRVVLIAFVASVDTGDGELFDHPFSELA